MITITKGNTRELKCGFENAQTGAVIYPTTVTVKILNSDGTEIHSHNISGSTYINEEEGLYIYNYLFDTSGDFTVQFIGESLDFTYTGCLDVKVVQ